MTTGPGSMPPKKRSACVAAQVPAANVSGDQADFEDRRLRPPHEQVDDEARGGSDRARRDREIAAVGDRREEDGEASHALTTRVSARRSCSARRSLADERGKEAEPDRQRGHEVAGGADDRLAEGDALGRAAPPGSAGITRMPAAILPIV